MDSAGLVERYRLLYRMLGARGRREVLFGSCGEPALEVFRSCAIGSRMPVVYIELPLLGNPRFDLQLCFNRENVMGDCELPATAPAVLGPLLSWLRGRDECPGIDLAFDVSSGEIRTPQTIAQMHRGSLNDAEGFFSAVGDAGAAARFEVATNHVPIGWTAWYVGFSAQRFGHPVRLDYSVSPKLQRAYLSGMRSLGEDLHAMGFDASEALLKRCYTLLELPFFANLQLDVLDDGSLGPVLGYSLGMPHWGPHTSREKLAQGGLGDAFSLVEDWGLADGRWRQIAGCCIGAAVELPGGHRPREVVVRCVPTFLKVRMTIEHIIDAKAYIMCHMGDA